MYLGPHFTTVDGEFIFAHFATTSVVMDCMKELSREIYDKYDLYSHEIEWLHIGRIGRCTWANVVRRNSDKTLDRFRKGDDKPQCLTCRGKGHGWGRDIEIWNGRPYIITKKENGQTDSSKIDWNNPAWCPNCKGSGNEI